MALMPVASALNLSEQRVQQLVHEGMPRESRGQYDAVKCMLWYIRCLQNALALRPKNKHRNSHDVDPVSVNDDILVESSATLPLQDYGRIAR